MKTVIISAIVSFIFFTAMQAVCHAESTPINVNTQRVVLVESFEVVCEHGPDRTVCVEIVTSGEDKGKSRTYIGPGSIKPVGDLATWDVDTDNLDPLAGI